MKKILLFTFAGFFSYLGFGQAQIGNSDMEQWEAVTSGEEPVNWNSFLSGTGAWSGFANDQIASSTDVRPGSAGTKSCRIFSNSVFSIVANGNVTLGQINMGSTTPTAPENYNFSKTSDSNFSEALTDHPDSIVFWAKFTPNGPSGDARMKATLHTNYDYRDPEDAAAANEVIATAVVNYPSTGGNWVRFSVPFQYTGPACISGQSFILITFTTNMTAGGGQAGDEVLIDDVELIYTGAPRDFDGDGVADDTETTDASDVCDFCDYNPANVTLSPSAAWEAADCDGDGMSNGYEITNGGDPLVAGLSELSANGITLSYRNDEAVIYIQADADLQGNYSVCNTMGQVIQHGTLAENVPFTGPAGMYFVNVVQNGVAATFEIVRF